MPSKFDFRIFNYLNFKRYARGIKRDSHRASLSRKSVFGRSGELWKTDSSSSNGTFSLCEKSITD